ncbi:isocitrate lyase/PEP mutase family protein [Lamprobacter modestohalophilus]|uniref:isocitrate lyase/PEP mutase family protein n=1 Tax=Lamprobacter modestohalophilus TaxID=1064514 RepID=UPI002ADEF61F|nr:isocitrate lyase/PEP mutase family protein [Lamprobacter modestohalophilus]MEA1052868.1 isocitrate lyase/PEP mutase family protein [Lamprobacter modestohalophilus]
MATDTLTTAPNQLRALLEQGGLISMPCCGDALSATLIEQAGFSLTFMSGFAAAAHRLGAPDTGLMSYAEVLDQGRNILEAVSIPVIGDGDTGYGNPLNLQRTLRGFAKAGFAAIMLEDQVAPKRCGHTRGKAVVEREEAFDRIRAAVEARDSGADILILARTDARALLGLNEAIERANHFRELGADLLFVEAPETREELATICRAAGVHLANMLEGGVTPILPPAELEALGYRIAAYPLTLLATAMQAMTEALDALKAGRHPQRLMAFPELRRRLGFEAYDATAADYGPNRATGSKA